jgi:hypothetical protein
VQYGAYRHVIINSAHLLDIRPAGCATTRQKTSTLLSPDERGLLELRACERRRSGRPRLHHLVVLSIRESRRQPFPVSLGLRQFGANRDNLALTTDQRRHRWSIDAANDLQQDRLL